MSIDSDKQQAVDLPSGWYVNFYLRDTLGVIAYAVGPYSTEQDAHVFKSQSMADKLLYDLCVEELR